MGYDLSNLIKVRLNTQKIKKEGFPIPSPEKDEDEQKYISRCISDIIDEYGQEQSSAICYGQWEKK